MDLDGNSDWNWLDRGCAGLRNSSLDRLSLDGSSIETVIGITVVAVGRRGMNCGRSGDGVRFGLGDARRLSPLPWYNPRPVTRRVEGDGTRSKAIRTSVQK